MVIGGYSAIYYIFYNGNFSDGSVRENGYYSWQKNNTTVYR